MRKIEQIKKEIQALTPEELTAFSKWFLEFDAAIWDRQIEDDAQAGKLDTLTQKVFTDFRSRSGSSINCSSTEN
jgi:hypothetical protein